MKRPRLKKRIRRGDGFSCEVSVVEKPELGERVRLVLVTPPKGQYVFDYSAEAAMELGRDLIGAGRHAIGLRRELEAEAARDATS